MDQIINCYPYRKANSIVQKDGGVLLSIHIYTFRNWKKTVYIVNVEEYEKEIFIVKFHTKNHRNSKRKYNLMTNQMDARRVIYSCIQICNDIFAIKPNASFGFIGSPIEKEILRKNKYYKTKRFKVYTKFAAFFFSPDNFIHKPNEEFSSYLLLNREKVTNNPEYHNEVVDMFAKYYKLSELFTS